MFKIDEKTLKEYARLGVEVGVNVQPGQPLQIMASVEAYELVRECVKVAYEKSASRVMVEYMDGQNSKQDYLHQKIETLCEVPEWQLQKMEYNIASDYCRLMITGDDPDAMNGVDAEKIQQAAIARMKATAKYRYYSMNSVGQWSILAYPEVHWARKVFPGLEDDQAMECLWKAILMTSRVELGKTVSNWKGHNEELRSHTEKLNDYGFRALHFKNGLGTDLRVGLVKDHIWEGGSECSKGKYKTDFVANIPTEEVFTMPDRYHIDGTVYSSKPLAHNGKVIPSFSLTFKDGKVIGYKAEDNEEVLKNILDTDEGSRSLGEVALISYDSPISRSGILFYDTLFDENASCHLALGACYPTTVKGGDQLSKEELYALGGNDSMNHVDFMFGTADLSVTGETYDGEMITVFESGNFVF